MIAPEHEKVFRVLDFIAEQKENGFKGHLPSIDIISQEQVISSRWKAAFFKDFHQIKELSMNVTGDIDG